MAKNPKKINPAPTSVKNYPDQRDGSFLEPHVTGLLPTIFRTDTNKKVLSAILEDLMQPSAMEDLDYSVGRNTTKTIITDYLPHSNARRQLEPAPVVFTEAGAETLSVDEIASAWGFNDRAQEPKVPVSVLDLPIDPDKFINWSDYHWIEEGMPVVYINGSTTETFSVQHDILGKMFFTTTEQGQQNNRRLTLKNGMRIVFRQFPNTLPLDGDLDIEMLSNGLSTQAIPYELTAYDKGNIGLSIDGVLQRLGLDFTLLGSEIQWKSTPPIAGLNIYIHLPNYFITTDANKVIRRWQVDGVGTTNGIRLLSRTHQYTNTSYSKATQTLWDKTAVPWDSVEWDGILRGINAKHYITQSPGAENRNANSRTNVWYHKDAISTVAEFLGITFADIALSSSQAIRPIVEFDNRLEIFNHGTKFRAWPNLLIKSAVQKEDFVGLPLTSAYVISNVLQTPVLDIGYTNLLDKLRFDPSIRVTVQSGFNTQTAINHADFTDSEISKLYEEQALAKAANRPFKKILYSVGNNKINWLINPPANGEVVTVTYFVNQVPLSSLRILWLVNDANINKILNLINNGTTTISALFETANNGDAVIIDTPIASDPNYLQEYYWKNGVAIKAQTRKSRTQLPTFELYDANHERLSSNPKKPLITSSTIIEPVEGTVMDPESGYKLTFLPSQFDVLSNDNPVKNAMFDIVFKHTLHDYSFYTDGDATKAIQGPYGFNRIYNNLSSISTGYLRAWFQLKSWVIKTIDNVTNPNITLDASVWPTYDWSVEIANGKINAVHANNYRKSVALNRFVGARGEPININVQIPNVSGSAKVSGYGIDDIDIIFISDTISFVIPADAPASLTLTIDNYQVTINVIDVKTDPRNVKVKLNGIAASYEFDNSRDENGIVTDVTLSVSGSGNLEIHHQGDRYDAGDHITSLPGLELNPFQTLSLGEFSPSRLVTAMTSAIETTKLSDSQSWIDSSKSNGLNGALMADNSALRSSWADLKLSPTLQDVVIARSLSSWRWYRKFIDKLETNSDILDYSNHTAQYNLDRLLNEMLVGVTYSSPDAVTGMAVPTDAMNYAEYLANGTQQSFKINTGNVDLYLGNFGTDIVYVYLDKLIVSLDDYTLEETTKSIKFKIAPPTGTIIEVYHAGEVEVFSGIPASVAKLGFKDAVRPEIITESYGEYSRKVIARHDGSRITMFGLDKTDPRNQIILELEHRIYNGCVNKYAYLAGNFPHTENRAWNTNVAPITESSTRAQLEWFDLNNINYRERHDYVNTNPWTWNYHGKSWKKLYIDKFNTYELDKEPWVALGYMYNKPAWWDTHYSWTNPTKRAALEFALYHGIISEPGMPITTDSTVSRKKWVNQVLERVRDFPVDDDGNLMDPMAWGYPQPAADVASLPWEIGACGPAEMAWRNSIAGQWFNVLFAIDDKKYCNEFFDVSMNPFIKPATSDSPRATGYSSVAPTPFTQTRPSIGIGALIFEAYREFNLSGETPLNDLLSIDCRLQFGMGGFSDGITSLKMYHTKYQLGSYVPEEDFMMTLSPGVPVSQLRYSAVRIEKDDVGYRVYGFDPGQRYFEVFTPTAKSVTSSFPSSRRPIITAYGEFTEYLDWDTTPVKIYYGDYIENNQALVTFLMGLGEFQKSKGLLLEAVNERGTITDWKQAALDALQWVHEYWGQDHNCIVGVATKDGLKFNHARGILERLDADLGRTGKVIFDNYRSALATDLLITRDYEPNVDKVVSLNSEQIAFVDFKLREYQHVVYIRRTTKFNDLILDLQTGHRLDVLNISARRTMAWTGRPNARGVSLTDTGLFPGFETLTTDILDVHKPEQNAFDVAESRIAKSNVVPARATVINELIQNRTMAHLYQQGLQSSSGTTLAINALLRNDMIDIPGRKQDIDVNEQWLFTTGIFGNLRGSQVWEIELRRQDFNTTKKVIRFSESNVENLNDNILEYNKKDKRWITRPGQPYGFNKINRATLGLDSTLNWLPNSGVSNLIDTDIQAVTISDVNIESFKSIDPLNKNISLSASGTTTTSDIFSTNSFSRYIDYDPDDLTWNEGKLYRAKIKISGSSTSAFSGEQWSLVEVDSRLLPAIWISDFGYIANSKYRGTWAPSGTLYRVGDLIEYQSKNYVCSVEHTSTGSFVSNHLTSIAVTNGGYNYTDNEPIRVTGEDGQFSTGKVRTKGGKISSISNVVDNAGGFSANTIVKVLDSNGQEHPLSSRAVLLPIISPSETKETNGAITSVSVPSTFIGGNNYFADNITVTLNGAGTGAVITPIIATQKATTRIIRGIYKAKARDLTASGTGYKVGDKMLLSNIGNESDDAIIEVTAIDPPVAPALSSLGRIISFTVVANSLGNKGGHSYKVGKEYSLTNINGTGTGAKITVQETINFDTGVVIYDTGVITGFAVTSPGKGYTNSTTLSISRSKPRATATVINGVITAITVDNQGRGKNMIFGDVEINIIPNGSGSNARARANIINGQLSTIEVLAGGAGYNNGARVVVVDPEWKETVTTSITLSIGTGNESLTNVVTGVTIIDGGHEYALTDSIVISDSTRDSLLPNATATVGSLINGTIYQVDVDQPNTANFYGIPTVSFNSGNNTATLTPVIQSFWNLRATGYGWNVLQTFNPMYVEEVCPNALNTGLNESKVTFSNPHGLTTGDYFVLAGANDGNYDKIHKVKSKVDDYNVLIEARSTSDQIVYNLVAFKMQSVRFNSKADYEKSKLTYNWQRGMKAYIDQDPTNTDLAQGNSFNYEFTEIEFGTNVGSTDKVINHSSYLIDTQSIYKVWLLDINTQEILTTIETYDPFKGVVVDDVAQYIEYKTSIDPSIYNVDELGIKDPLVAEAWAKERLGTLWWDTSRVRYIEYELGDVDTRANNWGKKFADTEVAIYEWTSSKELPTAETEGIKLDYSSGIGQIRYAEVEELNEFKVLSTVYYYWKRGASTLPATSKRPYAALTIEQVLDNPDANGVSWLSPVEVTADSASLLICNINDYFANRDSVILRIEQNFRPEQKHTTGVLVTEGFNGSEIPEYLYGRLRDSLVGEDKYRTIEPITYVSSGSSGIGLKVGDLITFINLDAVEFDFVTSYNGTDIPVLIDMNDERPDVKFVWRDNSDPKFGIYRARADIKTGEVLHSLSPSLKRVHTAISKNVLKDNRFYAVTDRPRQVPDPILHPLRRYGNNHTPRAQSWFKNATNARRTFIDCVNDFLLKIDVVSKTHWDKNLRTWRPLLGLKTLHLDPDWTGTVDNLNGYMQLWDYADYAPDDYVPGNEKIKLSSLSELPATLLEQPELSRFAVIDAYGITTEVYDYNNNNLTVVYRKNGTIQIRDLSDPAGWDTTRWDAKLWDPSRWDLGQILKALRENIFVGTDIGYFNSMFFAMVKESLVQIPMADWVFKTGYLSVDQTTTNDLRQVALYYNKKDGLIRDYINEVKPYHSKQIDKGTYSKATHDIAVSFDENIVITFTEPEFLTTEVLEDKLIDRRRNGTPDLFQIPQRILTQASERLMVRDHVLTQVIVTEEG